MICFVFISFMWVFVFGGVVRICSPPFVVYLMFLIVVSYGNVYSERNFYD